MISLKENQFRRVLLGFVPGGLVIDVVCVMPAAFMMLFSTSSALVSQYNTNQSAPEEKKKRIGI